jgi:hypothetical protein
MKRIILSFAILAASDAAQATPIQWSVASGGNGHYYEYVLNQLSWTDANAAANASTYFDGTNTLQGYLATVTSQAENDFLGTIGNHSSAWIGGSDNGHEGDWQWVGGPEAGITFWLTDTTLTYASWNTDDPNNSGNYLDFNGGFWDDRPDTANRGYIIEYSAASDTTDIPEPATLGLFGLGALALSASRRRKG